MNETTIKIKGRTYKLKYGFLTRAILIEQGFNVEGFLEQIQFLEEMKKKPQKEVTMSDIGGAMNSMDYVPDILLAGLKTGLRGSECKVTLYDIYDWIDENGLLENEIVSTAVGQVLRKSLLSGISFEEPKKEGEEEIEVNEKVAKKK